MLLLPLSDDRQRLLQLAREAGDRHFDLATGLCLIVRDTCWYATSLLFDASKERRQSGLKLLQTLRSSDGTHTPASMIALLQGMPSLLDEPTSSALRSATKDELHTAAGVEWKDGNVNHPLGAYCTLILGGELHEEPWATELGFRRLERFQRRIGDHRSRTLRQAEMSEYNSLTYTALDLTFLALIAEYARDDRARSLALFLEDALWVDVAMHYHAPSNQFAGPHSRSYFEDSFGGYSALHCAFQSASGRKVFLQPSLSVRFDHPSDLLQNALTAITPFHFPERARIIAWEKPLPYSFRMTTYGESYHENSCRTADTGSRDGDAVFAFDEEVYPGGWTDLTTYLAHEYALGSATLPYVNAGHTDSVMLRICRSENVQSLSHFRSAFIRGVYNDALPGVPNFCHTTSSRVDSSYLTEEGRCATYQHENRLIVAYSPKRAGHTGVRSFRTDFIFTYAAPFDAFAIDGKAIDAFPIEVPAGSRFCIRDHRTLILLIPLNPSPSSGTKPVRVWIERDFLVISTFNYNGSAQDFTRDEINAWRSGYFLEVRAETDFGTWGDFLKHAQHIHIAETVDERRTREIVVRSRDCEMKMWYDPFRERILSRTWCGVEDRITHLTVSAAGNPGGLFLPQTLFGSEGRNQ